MSGGDRVTKTTLRARTRIHVDVTKGPKPILPDEDQGLRVTVRFEGGDLDGWSFKQTVARSSGRKAARGIAGALGVRMFEAQLVKLFDDAVRP